MNSVTLTLRVNKEIIQAMLTDRFKYGNLRARAEEELLRAANSGVPPSMSCRTTWSIGGLNNCGMKLIQGLSSDNWVLNYLGCANRKELDDIQREEMGKDYGWMVDTGKIHAKPPANRKMWELPEVIGPKCNTYKILAKSINEGPPMAGFILSDNVSRSDGAVQTAFKCSDFVDWLVANDFGVVIQFPMALNPNHASRELATIIQAAYWIPPNFTKFSLTRNVRFTGRELLEGSDAWSKHWAGKLPADFHKTATKTARRRISRARSQD